MLHDESKHQIDRFTHGIVRRKVKQLIGRAGFTRQDCEDLSQEFFARVLQSLRSYDPAVGHRNKFVTAVVERHVATVLRNKRAEKRDDRQTTSLSVMIDIADEGPTEFAQTIGDREFDARLGRHRRSEVELSQLRLDLHDMIGTLPESWQTLLELRKTRTMSEAANAMGVPRTTLDGWMRRIRKRFEKVGLRAYLES